MALDALPRSVGREESYECCLKHHSNRRPQPSFQDQLISDVANICCWISTHPKQSDRIHIPPTLVNCHLPSQDYCLSIYQHIFEWVVMTPNAWPIWMHTIQTNSSEI